VEDWRMIAVSQKHKTKSTMIGAGAKDFKRCGT
jgi:hypothetical protein